MGLPLLASCANSTKVGLFFASGAVTQQYQGLLTGVIEAAPTCPQAIILAMGRSDPNTRGCWGIRAC